MSAMNALEIGRFRSRHSEEASCRRSFRATFSRAPRSSGCGQVDRLQREIPDPHVVVVAGDAVVVDESFAGDGGR
jgi:hypothetical protein